MSKSKWVKTMGGEGLGVGVGVGEIRVLSNQDIDRLVLVLGVHAPSKTCRFTLLHSYTEYATQGDLIIEPVVSGMRYPLVVQGDIEGVVYTDWLGNLVGRLPMPLECGGGVYRGVHRVGGLDAIWDFKASEGNDIRNLSSVLHILYD